jgi:hypothetical protein
VKAENTGRLLMVTEPVMRLNRIWEELTSGLDLSNEDGRVLFELLQDQLKLHTRYRQLFEDAKATIHKKDAEIERLRRALEQIAKWTDDAQTERYARQTLDG